MFYKKILYTTVSRFKAMKARAQREKFDSNRIQVMDGPPEHNTPKKQRTPRKMGLRSVSAASQNVSVPDRPSANHDNNSSL